MISIWLIFAIDEQKNSVFVLKVGIKKKKKWHKQLDWEYSLAMKIDKVISIYDTMLSNLLSIDSQQSMSIPIFKIVLVESFESSFYSLTTE